MRPMMSSLAAAVLLAGTAGHTLAEQQPCMRAAEKAAFDIAGLKSHLMVIAIDCQAQEKYNAFVARFRPDLQGSEKGLNTYFQRTARRGTAQAHDDYITSLANAQSDSALSRGTLFCDENVHVFDSVLALKDGRDLLSYASSQGLRQPIEVVECPAPTPQARKPKTLDAKATAIKPAATKAVATK